MFDVLGFRLRIFYCILCEMMRSVCVCVCVCSRAWARAQERDVGEMMKKKSLRTHFVDRHVLILSSHSHAALEPSFLTQWARMRGIVNPKP